MKYTALELKSNADGIVPDSLKALNKFLRKGWVIDNAFGLPGNCVSQLIVLRKREDCCTMPKTASDTKVEEASE